MQCFHPIDGYRRADGGFTPSKRNSAETAPMVVRCGRCLGCRVNRRDEWKLRCLHEAKLHAENAFVTLTYDDAHMPPFGSVRMDDVSAWIKRLRFFTAPRLIRFLAKTEYGPRTFRPHAHVLLFGISFREDRVAVRRTKSGELSYRSALLTKSYGLGVAECSDLTPRSVGYVANHNVDKLGDGHDAAFYERVDPATGEVVELERESIRVSNRPGIGSGWLDRYESDAFPSGFVISEGMKKSIPRYYKKRLRGRFELAGSYEHTTVPFDDARLMAEKSAEFFDSDEARFNNTPERLAVREQCLFERTKRLRREEF